jgi:mono/diheme cytochrome c family protein
MPILRHSVLILISISLVVAQARQSRSDDTEYRTDIYPILENHCIGCHGADQQEGNLRLDNLSVAFLEDRAAAEHWHEVLNALQKGEMPPREEPQLSSDQLARITAWLTRSLKLAAEAQRTTEGRTILRRLNRVEYQNTMYDLLDLEMDYARDLPPDALSEDGFQNNGEALQMSSLQLEYYLATARRALDRVIVQGGPTSSV